MSHSSVPTLPWVLPLYHMIRKELLEASENMDLPNSIREGALAAIVKLDKYFVKAKDNQYVKLATRKSIHLHASLFR